MLLSTAGHDAAPSPATLFLPAGLLLQPHPAWSPAVVLLLLPFPADPPTCKGAYGFIS